MRIKIIRVITIALFLVLAGALFFIQVIKGTYYFNLSKNNRIRVVHLEGWRGRIYDRQDRLIADNHVSYNLVITPQDIADKDKLFAFLADVLRVDADRIKTTFDQKRFAPFTPVVLKENLNREEIFAIEEHKHLFPSLLIQESYRRTYPLGEAAAHVLGYVGKINPDMIQRNQGYGYTPQSIVGYSGVEEFYDAYLRGGEGGIQIEVNSRGRQVRVLSLKQPTPGQDLTLTIDQDIQKINEGLLRGYEGAIVVMDAATGEVLGLNSAPTFDVNIFVNPKLSGERKQITQDKRSPLLDRATRGMFPPGSVFKIPVALAGLETKKTTSHTPFFCPGYHEVGGTRFGCAHMHGEQNLLEAIKHSCNVYFYRVGLLLGADTMYRYARLLGLGDVTHIDLPYEKGGFIPQRSFRFLSGQRWYTGDTINMSIGQGDVLATPLQLARMMAVISENGLDVQPHVIKRIGSAEINRYQSNRKVPIAPQNIDFIKKGLRAAVTDYSGTAIEVNIAGLHVAGKTGTAQSSKNKEDHAWFAGYVHGKKRLAFCVFLEHGGSSHNACRLARQLLVELQRLNII